MIYAGFYESGEDIPVNYGEVARYSGAKGIDGDLAALIGSCVRETQALNAVKFSTCYAITPCAVNADIADFTAFKVKSKDLAKNLRGAGRALIFACTVGIGIDRLIKKYADTSPSRSLIFHALGAERVESFIGKFLCDFKAENRVSLTPRFSSGYGDLALETQRDIFRLLQPEKRLGLTLNGSLLMSPSKSVTAIAGILCGNAYGETENGCSACGKTDCEFCK